MSLHSYVALLRAVNVSGQNPIDMADLRARLSTRGYRDVATYLQSGNVVFEAVATPEPKLVRAFEHEITEAFGLSVTVLVRTRDQWKEIRARNPFRKRGSDPATLHVTFLADVPSPAEVKALSARAVGPDEAVVRGREVYLHCPNGYGRTKLNNAFLERQLDTRATTRSWKTVTKLLELAH